MTSTRQRIYNPAQLNPEERAAFFAVRERELDTILNLLRRHRPGDACQNAVLLGTRGMGKSTLGLRALDIVAMDETLSQKWQPIAFPEENYGISSLGELWSMALEVLSATTGEKQWGTRARALLEQERDDRRLEELAYAALMDFRRESGRIPLLFVENLDLIFEQFSDDNDPHRLREHLMGKDEVFFLGGATHLFDGLSNPAQPLFEFFRVIELEPLGPEECLTLIRRISQAEGESATESLIEESAGRIQAIRALTGGNPRLIALSWRLVRDSPLGSARDDLERLIDEQTPYFQSRIEKLAPQARKVFHAVAKIWSPALTKEIAAESRLSSSHTSAQLRLLRDMGYIESLRLDEEKRDRYQLVDRFYGIYFLMRFTRDRRIVVEGLVEFLHLAYGPRNIWRMLFSTLSNAYGSDSTDIVHSMNAMALKVFDNIDVIGIGIVLNDLSIQNINSFFSSIYYEKLVEEIIELTKKNLNVNVEFDEETIKIYEIIAFVDLISKSREKKNEKFLFISLLFFIFLIINSKDIRIHVQYISVLYAIDSPKWIWSLYNKFTEYKYKEITNHFNISNENKRLIPEELKEVVRTINTLRSSIDIPFWDLYYEGPKGLLLTEDRSNAVR